MDEEKVTLWKQRLLSFQSSVLPVKEWCKENHVAPPTFYYWESWVEKENDDKQPSFVEVTTIEKNRYNPWKNQHFSGVVVIQFWC